MMSGSRLPTDADTIDGRIPIIDEEGYLGFAVLAGSAPHQFMICETGVKYWLEAVPASPDKE